MLFALLPLNRDHAKYTVPSQAPPVRSASIEVLSWNTPSKLGAAEPLATIVLPRKRLPSSIVAPFSPAGLSKVATHSSPNVLAVPAGSPELSDPKNTRPWASQAMTGSPALAVRTFASTAYGEVSPGYPGTSELWKLTPPFSDR